MALAHRFVGISIEIQPKCRFISSKSECLFFFQIKGLSRDQDGLLIVEMDLNLCRQVKDHWGLRMTQRLADYGRDFSRAAELDFKPQLI